MVTATFRNAVNWGSYNVWRLLLGNSYTSVPGSFCNILKQNVNLKRELCFSQPCSAELNFDKRIYSKVSFIQTVGVSIKSFMTCITTAIFLLPKQLAV
jgi:hypothetical protein